MFEYADVRTNVSLMFSELSGARGGQCCKSDPQDKTAVIHADTLELCDKTVTWGDIDVPTTLNDGILYIRLKTEKFKGKRHKDIHCDNIGGSWPLGGIHAHIYGIIFWISINF